ncbi:MAG: phage terminase large subunit [Rickettsiales bacterium]|jgi:hypothetical protein|nr:phage terminase large subunit [Rickettsiales bacterium]
MEQLQDYLEEQYNNFDFDKYVDMRAVEILQKIKNQQQTQTQKQLQPKLQLNDGQNNFLNLFKEKKYTHYMLFGGSRTGKSFIITILLLSIAKKYPGSRILIGRYTLKSLKLSIINDVLKKVLEYYPSLKKDFHLNRNRQENYWELDNGSIFHFSDIGNEDEVEKLLGTEYNVIWLNETSEIGYSSVLKLRTRLSLKVKDFKNVMLYDCNPPSKSHWSYKEFIAGINPLNRKEMINNKDYTTMKFVIQDNLKNINDNYVKELENLPEQQKKRFLYGEWGDEVQGAVFSKYIKEDQQASYNNDYECYVAFDIGYNDQTAMWLYQKQNKQLHFLDYYENRQENLKHYLDKINEWNKTYPLTNNKTIFLPHDGDNHEFIFGITRKEFCIKQNFNALVLPKINESSQVDLTRNELPNCYFDKEKCYLGLERLKNARYEYIERVGIYREGILHDENSDGTKAFIYAIMSLEFIVGKPIEKQQKLTSNEKIFKLINKMEKKYGKNKL